jgi:hypothetical protein
MNGGNSSDWAISTWILRSRVEPCPTADSSIHQTSALDLRMLTIAAYWLRVEVFQFESLFGCERPSSPPARNEGPTFTQDLSTSFIPHQRCPFIDAEPLRIPRELTQPNLPKAGAMRVHGIPMGKVDVFGSTRRPWRVLGEGDSPLNHPAAEGRWQNLDSGRSLS